MREWPPELVEKVARGLWSVWWGFPPDAHLPVTESALDAARHVLEMMAACVSEGGACFHGTVHDEDVTAAVERVVWDA